MAGADGVSGYEVVTNSATQTGGTFSDTIAFADSVVRHRRQHPLHGLRDLREGRSVI